jgi:hypothetical protein
VQQPTLRRLTHALDTYRVQMLQTFVSRGMPIKRQHLFGLKIERAVDPKD